MIGQRYKGGGVLLFLLMVCFSGVITIRGAQAATSVLPLNHRAYEFLERLYTRGLCSSFFINTKPMTRMEAAEAIAEIVDSEEKVSSLSIVEQEELEFLVKEFVEELVVLIPGNIIVEGAKMPRLGWWWKPEAFPGLFYDNDRNFYKLERSNCTFFLDPILVMNTRVVRSDTVDQN